MNTGLKALRVLYTCTALVYSSKSIAAELGQKLFQVRQINQNSLQLGEYSWLSIFFDTLDIAWEKRTDISTAINVATKKRIPRLVQELKVKLDSLPQVSHTTVIKRKEEHLASKTLKSDLHRLANRRFGRAQEVSTERAIAVMSLWAKREFFSFSNIHESIVHVIFLTWLMFLCHSVQPPDNIDEESVAIEEVKALGEVIQEVEQSIQSIEDVHTALNQAIH